MSGGEGGPTASEGADALVGRLLSDRYRILRKLGEGGMASVYLAEHIALEKKVAVKVLAPELARREELAARFLQEARAASRIGQENVIDISDFGRADGLVFFAMEYLEGADLGEVLRHVGAIGWPRARGILIQICKALRAAHAQGIVHRDLKPENVFLIQREGRVDFVKLLDFGIAKLTGTGLGTDGPRLTRTGMIFGTPEYMAPEQAEGKEADHRVDLYSAGCVLYHCLVGEPPFQAESFMAMLTKHLVEAPVLPSVRRPELQIPPTVDRLVARALEKDREYRWATADDFMTAVLNLDEAGGLTGAAGTAELNPGSSARAAVTRSRGGDARSSRATTPAGWEQPPSVAAAVGAPGLGNLKTEVFSGPDYSASALPVARARAPLSRFSLLAALGIGLGIAAAALFVLLRRDAQPVPGGAPASAGAPTEHAAPPGPVPGARAQAATGAAGEGAVPVATKPAEQPAGDPGSPAARHGKDKPERKRPRKDQPRLPDTEAVPAAAPAPRGAPPPATPSELKPFPS